MAGQRILSGQKFNLFERGVVTVTTTHAQLTKDRLFDGRPSRAYRAGTLAADQFVTVDGNLFTDGTTNYGGFETWAAGTPAGWTEIDSGTGTVTQDTVVFNSGASSAKIFAGTVSAILERYQTVRSGETLNWSLFLSTNADAGAHFKVRIYNPLTQKYLSNFGTWGSSGVDVLDVAGGGAGFQSRSNAFTVEDFATCQSDLVSLRIWVYCDNVGKTVWVDDFYMWPRVNFASIHGHNFDPGVGLQLVSSTDAFVGVATNEGTPTLLRPSFYVLPAATNQDRRWWGWRVVNANSVAFEIGETVIGYARQPLVYPETPIGSGSTWDYQASINPSGERHVHKRSKYQARSRVFNYHCASQAEYDDLYELMHLRSEGGTYPVVIVPDTALTAVLQGRLRTDFPDSRTFIEYYTDISVELQESPFASTAY